MRFALQVKQPQQRQLGDLNWSRIVPGPGPAVDQLSGGAMRYAATVAIWVRQNASEKDRDARRGLADGEPAF